MTWKEHIRKVRYYLGEEDVTEVAIAKGIEITFPKDEIGRQNRAWPSRRVVSAADMDTEYDPSVFRHSMGCMASISILA